RRLRGRPCCCRTWSEWRVPFTRIGPCPIPALAAASYQQRKRSQCRYRTREAQEEREEQVWRDAESVLDRGVVYVDWVVLQEQGVGAEAVEHEEEAGGGTSATSTAI
ncbi:hypothetical protein BGZ52_003909, partial [Haplosporangium bisporale]